jgi:hypothetical protein
MTDVGELLDTIVPRHQGAGDWNRVLRDADIDQRPLRTPLPAPLRLAAALALVAAIAGVVAFWPTGGTGPSVLDRALAATGDGAVLHLVYESELPKTLVDLETGERTELRAEHEVWFDPQAGLRETERFDGVVQFDVSLGPDEMSEHASSLYTSLGAAYREALESGQAEVVGEEVVDGTAVYWIRLEAGHDVAVSRSSFEPAYIRVMQEGGPALNRIVSYETVEAGSAPLQPAASENLPAHPGTYGGEIELADARQLLGRDPVWAGASLEGLPLESVREVRLPAENADVPGLSLMYGSPQDGPHVEITEAATLADGLTMLVGLSGYAPPEGTALLAGPVALLRSNGLVVVIHAPDEETAIAVARSLQPYSG